MTNAQHEVSALLALSTWFTACQQLSGVDDLVFVDRLTNDGGVDAKSDVHGGGTGSGGKGGAAGKGGAGALGIGGSAGTGGQPGTGGATAATGGSPGSGGSAPGPTCSDDQKNGGETDTDCGGGSTGCRRCDSGRGCASNNDCASSVCDTTDHCAVPTCTDTKVNGTEGDVDCGGNCPNKCADGRRCQVHGDCQSDLCDSAAGICIVAGCGNGAQDGQETDKDCGGNVCPKCKTGQKCLVGADCEGLSCPTGVCLGNCNDGTQNGMETDKDCGGTCPKCKAGQKCGSAHDCESAGCINYICTSG